MKQPKILFYDIETEPNHGYTWGRWEQTVIAFSKERSLLSFAYKWLGGSKVTCKTRKGLKTDKTLVAELAALIDEADIIVAHNGDQFDRKVLTARMVYWGMRPLKSNCSVDTKKVAKRYFSFNGNSLQDLCVFLGIGRKKQTEGFELWLSCMRDESRSWAKMAAYNIQDVVILEKLYKRFLPWIENHPSFARLLGSNRKACNNCAEGVINKRGIRATRMGLKQRWQCVSCGSWSETTYKVAK